MQQKVYIKPCNGEECSSIQRFSAKYFLTLICKDNEGTKIDPSMKN